VVALAAVTDGNFGVDLQPDNSTPDAVTVAQLREKYESEAREWRDTALAVWLQLGEKIDQLENRSVELENRIQSLNDHIQQLSSEIQSKQEALDYFTSSPSWKITEPLRAVRRLQTRKQS